MAEIENALANAPLPQRNGCDSAWNMGESDVKQENTHH